MAYEQARLDRATTTRQGRDKENDMSAAAKADLLYGVKAIADHLGVTKRQALYLKEKGVIPTFYIDSTVCSRRSDLNAWLEAQAKGGQANG